MKEEIDVLREKAGCGRPPKQIHVVLLLFYVVVGLLNGEALLREAELLRYGRGRDFCVALARPLAAASRALGLNRPRAAIERQIYGERP